jgi:hypothetical protein
MHEIFNCYDEHCLSVHWTVGRKGRNEKKKVEQAQKTKGFESDDDEV